MLTADQLRDVIAQGEQIDVEFRGDEQGAVSDTELVETVTCLANARGGIVLVGVEDDGRITGARPHDVRMTKVGCPGLEEKTSRGTSARRRARD